jgi:hypothetical protein
MHRTITQGLGDGRAARYEVVLSLKFLFQEINQARFNTLESVRW